MFLEWSVHAVVQWSIPVVTDSSHKMYNLLLDVVCVEFVITIHIPLSLSTFFYSEGDQLASTVQKNISELAVNLLHLQQNIAIPEISLPIHPIIQDAVTLASREDRKPTIEDIGNNISDTTFLSALQKQVTNWTTEIRRVSVSFSSAV